MDKIIMGSTHIWNWTVGNRLIVLYDDGSCENLFTYDGKIRVNRLNGSVITGKTRSQAISKLMQLCEEGKIHGTIPVKDLS